MKRTIMIVFLLLGLVLSACSGNNTPANNMSDNNVADNNTANNDTEAQDTTAEQVELRFMYYQDGSEAEVMQGLLDQFMAENPDIVVILDNVPYATIDEQLPIQVDTEGGPDLARITNFGIYQGQLLDLRDYLSNAAYYQDNFPAPILESLGYGGYPDALTVTGPFVNATLFEQAGVSLPGEGATWADWTEATTQVAEATGVQFAISIDRTGHRFAGPAMSNGAVLIDESGSFTVDTPGFRSFAETLKSWHTDGITPSEVWLVGDGLNNCIDYFKSADLVMCMTGSWQVGGVASDVGDAFDWIVVPNPTGDGGSTGVAGGSAVVAFENTEHPAEVARLIEFLISQDAYSQFSAATLALPAHTGAASAGIDFETEDAAVLDALSAFTAEVPKLQDQAVELNVHPFAFAYYRNSADRIAQYLTEELTLDEALARLQQDIDDAIAEASN